ncbi:transposase [Frankia gtarii]|uniref:transposase n=1 Tax=Frankia gtarii TaxID=2950102 RepID=UPI0021C24106|nr:transposase [Frankia gtarii]
MPRPTRYPPHFRAEAIAQVKCLRPDHPSEWSAIQAVANVLTISPETLRTWIRDADEIRRRPRAKPHLYQAELRRLLRENAELRRAVEFLSASRPPTAGHLATLDADAPDQTQDRSAQDGSRNHLAT